ncbi:choice-of-anchor B family protein [Zhouia spongiae]|uniref:Choice-of-anchor B family protein n=1 Tax=Zhouia spongiae TaxID=2202721 RepID=A0ABY3YPL8_9FLAO|nr:choice-of-anchor B family protein [Zhouia spongiae]UNY99787.1 choice-of-anchor B family protein [Zhouia spongiae]
MKSYKQCKSFFFVCLLTFTISCSKSSPSDTIAPDNPLPDFSFISQTDIPGNIHDIWGFTKNGEEYAVITGKNNESEAGNTTIINISNPSNPNVVSTILTEGADVKLWKDFLYIAQGGITEGDPPSAIYNISDPETPVFVGTFPAFHNIFIDRLGYLYVSGYHPNAAIPGSEGLNVSIYDLNNTPDDPELIWTAPDNDQPSVPVHDMAVVNNKLYVFDIELSKVDIYNVIDRNAPVHLGTYQFTNNQKVHSGWPSTSEQYLYVCLEEGAAGEDIIILDISDPAAAFMVGSIHDRNNTIHNLYVKGNRAYTSFYKAGLRVYDLSVPSAPELLYEYDTNGSSPGLGAFGVYPFSASGYISVSDVENGLLIFEEH